MTFVSLIVLATIVPAGAVTTEPPCPQGMTVTDFDVHRLDGARGVQHRHRRGWAWTVVDADSRSMRVVYDRSRKVIRNVGPTAAQFETYCQS